MPAGRRCRTCPAIIPARSPRGLCPTCYPLRGTTLAQGYGSTVLPSPIGTMTYDACRAEYQRRLNAGEAIGCARCGEPVGIEFHLDHSDDRSRIDGPSHPRCNLSAAGRASGTKPRVGDD